MLTVARIEQLQKEPIGPSDCRALWIALEHQPVITEEIIFIIINECENDLVIKKKELRFNYIY